MTELFARLAPGADLQMARAELNSLYGVMKREHPEDYPAKADFRISAVKLRDQLTSGARTILLVLMAASMLIFVIACSNVANLILARTVRRENELGIRAALGAGTGALRRTLLAESLLLCVAGATIGILIARPLVAVLARYASRYSVRALDLQVDSSMLVGGSGTGRGCRSAAGFRSAPALLGRRPGILPGERRRSRHRDRQPEVEDLRGGSDRRLVRSGSGGRLIREDTAGAGGGTNAVRYAPRAGGGSSRDP